MKKWKVALLMLMAFCLISGCGKKEAGTSKAVQNKDHVYSFESYMDKLEGRDFGQSIATKDRLIFMEYRYEESPMPQARAEEAVATSEIMIDADMSVDMPVDDF